MARQNEAPYGQDASKDRLLFAVIREDPRLEGDLVHRTRAKEVLTIASGGCVALSLASRFPGTKVTAFDKSQAQLDHVRAKIAAAQRGDSKALNVEEANAEALNQCGEFEKVFRLLRKFFEEFIVSHADLLAYFTRNRPVDVLDGMTRRWTSSRYWSVAFHACFTDELLKTTLGARALRHATAGSYPEYFQRAFARGLRRDNAPENPFLQHVFLGGYRRGCEPRYIRHPELGGVELVHGSLEDVPDLGRYDVVSLSNILDTFGEARIEAWAALLKEKMKPGAALLIRQFNTVLSVRPFFESDFTFDSQLGRSYFYRDRSLFYDRFEVGFKKARATT
jgi:S-adenosylmethionine-diacylglycerol 3-amino-3-carboxypropyl transferase